MLGAPTISDLLATGQRLELYCRRCDRPEVLLTPAEAIARFGTDCTYAEAAERSRCDACKARGRDGYIGARPSVSDMYRAAGMTANHAQGEDAWKRRPR